MKKYCLWSLLILVGMHAHQVVENIEWTVVGAGPAGIAAVGLLVDAGINPQQIAWVDPKFDVGRLGQYYTNVPGNATTQMYIDFLRACKTFMGCKSDAINNLYAADPNKEYKLSIIVEPLRDITSYIRNSIKVRSFEDKIISLDYKLKQWEVGTEYAVIQSKNVILATGSVPRTFDYECKHVIPLDIALDIRNLRNLVRADDTVAIVGSAHSAVLLMMYLTEIGVARIINFYKHPISYPTENFDNWNAGLKGDTARWAKEVLEKNPPANLLRIFNTPDSLKTWLPVCTKLIYACGFERAHLPAINGDFSIYDRYDTSSGMIAPGLFGIGIAFPEHYKDSLGNLEIGIGLADFMDYIQRNMPEWLKQNRKSLCQFKELFCIKVL